MKTIYLEDLKDGDYIVLEDEKILIVGTGKHQEDK